MKRSSTPSNCGNGTSGEREDEDCVDPCSPAPRHRRVQGNARRQMCAHDCSVADGAPLPAKRRAKVERRAAELATLKDLRQAVRQTQGELASALGVGQDTISRLEQRSDMLLSTLKRYVEAMGGTLDIVARFPNRPPLVIEQIARKARPRSRQRTSRSRTKVASATA